MKKTPAVARQGGKRGSVNREQFLPEEILLLIFTFLDDTSLIRTRLVSTRWKAVSEDPSNIGGRAVWTPYRLHVCVMGSHKAGKSTLIGRLVTKLRPASLRKLREVSKGIAQEGMEAYANPYQRLVDLRPEEKKTCMTNAMYHTSVKLSFSTTVTLWNVSGRRERMPHIFRVASMCDVGFLVIPAIENVYKADNHGLVNKDSEMEKEKEKVEEKEKEKGEKEKGDKLKGKPYKNKGGAYEMGLLNEQLLLAKTAGLKRVIVLVNQMDLLDGNSGDDKRVFEAIRDDVISSNLLKNAGFTSEPVIVPCSALHDVNIVSHGYSWYEGPTVMEAIKRLASVNANYRYPRDLTKKQEPSATDDPFVLPLHEIFKISGIGLVASGRVKSGSIKAGSQISCIGTQTCVAPGLKASEGVVDTTVKSLETEFIPIKLARPGDYVSLNIKNLALRDLATGFVLAHGLKASVAVKCKVFVQLVAARGLQVRQGVRLNLLMHCAVLPCIVKRMRLLDKKGLVVNRYPKDPAKTGDHLLLRLAFDSRNTTCTEGERVALRDNNSTLAVGYVKKVMSVTAWKERHKPAAKPTTTKTTSAIRPGYNNRK